MVAKKNLLEEVGEVIEPVEVVEVIEVIEPDPTKPTVKPIYEVYPLGADKSVYCEDLSEWIVGVDKLSPRQITEYSQNAVSSEMLRNLCEPRLAWVKELTGDDAESKRAEMRAQELKRKGLKLFEEKTQAYDEANDAFKEAQRRRNKAICELICAHRDDVSVVWEKTLGKFKADQVEGWLVNDFSNLLETSHGKGIIELLHKADKVRQAERDKITAKREQTKADNEAKKLAGG